MPKLTPDEAAALKQLKDGLAAFNRKGYAVTINNNSVTLKRAEKDRKDPKTVVYRDLGTLKFKNVL